MVDQRRRLEVKGLRQEQQPDFDSRIVRRIALLSAREREAVEALMRLRRQHPGRSPVAANFDVETTFETELDSPIVSATPIS